MPDEIANQSEEVVEQSANQEVESQEADTIPIEYDTIKHNHEEVKIPVTERQTYLQKGYNYDKVNERATQLETQVKYMEKQAKIYGYDSVETYMKALDEHERLQEIQAEAKKYGVPEDFIRGELKPLKDKIQQYEQQIEQNTAKENERVLQTDLDKVRAANPDFDNYFDQIVPLFQKGYSLADAYRLASYEDKFSSIGLEKEQEVLANITKKDNKQVLSSKDKPNNLALTPSNMSFADIEAMSKRVQAGEKIKFN